VARKGERKREREREKTEKTESVLTLTFGEYPCSYEKGCMYRRVEVL
jgi:hypothetical protein